MLKKILEDLKLFCEERIKYANDEDKNDSWHHGYKTASEQVLSSINSYIETMNLEKI